MSDTGWWVIWMLWFYGSPEAAKVLGTKTWVCVHKVVSTTDVCIKAFV